jgi:hypothetical protein
MNKKMSYALPPPGVDVKAPLIYMWEIADLNGQIIGRYVGKASGGEKRPRQHYSRNVDKLLRGLPYKKDRDYRLVHVALADAVDAGHPISLHYLCNVPDDQNIFAVEMDYIRQYGCHIRDGIGLNGPGAVSQRPHTRVSQLPKLPLSSRLAAEANLSDLEDFVECIEHFVASVEYRYRERFEVRAGTRRYSLWLGDKRLIRAEQSGPRGRVRIKLPRAGADSEAVEFGWEGGDEQLIEAIERQLHQHG